MNDTISRQAAIEAVDKNRDTVFCNSVDYEGALYDISNLPSAQPERLTDDDFETIRIHLNAYKEKLCNQHRWEEANEYQRIIDRFMAFASAQPERQKGEWIDYTEDGYVECPFCHSATNCDGNKDELHFCFSCGADMRGEQDG